MVFNGKPSQGCGTCRRRRIRCDQHRPSCGQCLKSNRECQGYRDPDDTLVVHFHGPFWARGASSSREKALRIHNSCNMALQPVVWPLSRSTEQEALTYFFSEFITLTHCHDASRSYVENIVPFYEQARNNSPFLDAIRAAALASFAHFTQSTPLAIRSHVYYSKAVSGLQAAITDTVSACADETLISVLILGLTDVMTASEQSLFNWTHHADGAAALIHYRSGQEMLAHPMSSKIYWAVRSQSVWNSSIKCEPLEQFPDLESLWTMPVDLSQATHATKLVALCERIPALRANACKWLEMPMSSMVVRKCANLLVHCEIMDMLLLSWSEGMPTCLRPRRLTSIECTSSDMWDTSLYPCHLETYPDLLHGSLWNMWRTFRIQCQMMILNCCERLFPLEMLPAVSEYQRATAIIQDMVNEVCASVPYHLGYPMPFFETDNVVVPTALRLGQPDSKRPQQMNPHHQVGLIGALYLILPCFFACSAGTIPVIQRTWLRERLLDISKRAGYRQAAVLAKFTAIEPPRRHSVTDFAPASFGDYRIEPIKIFLGSSTELYLDVNTSEACQFRDRYKKLLWRLLEV